MTFYVKQFFFVISDESFGANDSQSAPNIVHQSIIKRFNQHSIMVMNAGQDKVAANAEQDPATKGDKTKERLLTAEEEKQNVEAKRKRLHDMTEYEDLEQVPAKKPATLNISRSDRYVCNDE